MYSQMLLLDAPTSFVAWSMPPAAETVALEPVLADADEAPADALALVDPLPAVGVTDDVAAASPS